MKIVFASSLIAATLLGAVPTFAQGVYIGPNGVGVDPGLRDRGYDNDRRNYRNRDDDEGRSAYERRGRNRNDDDDR